MQTKHMKSLAREVAHILILFENWHAASKRLPTPDVIDCCMVPYDAGDHFEQIFLLKVGMNYC